MNYLDGFKQAEGTFELFGSKLLVERLEINAEVKSAGGIILSAANHAKSTLKKQEPLVARVLASGQGYTNEDGTSIPLDVRPGNIVVLNPNGVNFFSTLPGVPSYTDMKIGITTEGDVQMCFKDVEAFNAYCKVFGGEGV